MAQFLNTAKLNIWLPKLIDEAERELVILVPYIKMTDEIYNCLVNANKRGVETTLVYREAKVKEKEIERLKLISNLNLLHHPNLHAKCYINESYVLITSMNLYEYSLRNNREMGVLLDKRRTYFEKGFGNNATEEETDLFEDVIEEVKHIINGARIIKKSKETIEEGFEMDIIKSKLELCQDKCKELNRIFVHKKFEPCKIGFDKYVPICSNYFDKVDVLISHRVELKPFWEESILINLFESTKNTFSEFFIPDCKFYWNYAKGSMFLYLDTKSSYWNNDTDNYELLKPKLDELIQNIRKHL